MRQQHVAIPRWYRQPALAIQIELCRPLKHGIPLSTHLFPLITTSSHYIEIKWGGQARKWKFSLRDKGLAAEVNEKQNCLKSNGLGKYAKVVCNGRPVYSYALPLQETPSDGERHDSIYFACTNHSYNWQATHGASTGDFGTWPLMTWNSDPENTRPHLF
jgi:hypothetical protein